MRRTASKYAAFFLVFGTSFFFLPQSAYATCVSQAQAQTIAAAASPTPAGETPTVTTLETCAGDDVGYAIPITTSVTFDGVQYNNVYATTNSVITFGQADGTYWTYPNTPSISVYSMDWLVIPSRNPDEHLIINASDGGFQVDLSARPYGNYNVPNPTNIIITAAINTDGTVAISYAVTGATYDGQTRTGVRLTNGSVVTLEQYGIVQVEVAPTLAPTPEPSPTPSDNASPSASPQPTQTPTPEPSVTPTDGATATASPSPSTEPTMQPSPSPSPEPSQSPSPTPSPEISPSPSPTPTPEPTPSVPTPAPVVEPTPAPAPQEPPQPAPQPAPSPALPPDPLPEPVSEPEPIVELPPPEPVVEAPLPVEEPPPAVDETTVPESQPEPAPEPETAPEQTVEPSPVEPQVESPDNVVPESYQPSEPPVVIVTPSVAQQVVQLTPDTDLTALPPDTPVALENGVVVTAEVAIAVELLQDPGELLATVFTDPMAALAALSNVGADLPPEVREKAEDVIVSAVIAGNIATQAAGAAAAAASYRRKP